MRTFVVSRPILSISAGAALLAGCALPLSLSRGQSDAVAFGGAAAMIPQTGAVTTRFDRGRSWMLPEAKSKHLLYITNYTKVEVYSYPRGALVGELTGFTMPYGDCADKQGNVYITDFGATFIGGMCSCSITQPAGAIL